jgi:hypothetical protein
MPAGQGKDAERFDAAVEQGTPPGFAVDDELARELEIVAMLRSRSAAYAPDPDAKARAKQRLMAVLAAEHTAPMGIVKPAFPAAREDVDATAETAEMAPVTARQDEAAEPDAEPADETVAAGRPGRHSRHSVANRPAGRPRASRRPAARNLRRRVALVGSAALVMMIALAGGGILASRDALPGDSLYAVKRVAESAGLALTFDEAAKARRHLEIATIRLSEVERLVARHPEATVDPEVYSAAMQEFDAATDEGSRMLLTAAEAGGNSTALDDLHTWATEQSARLAGLRPALPLPAVVGADGSIQLLDQLLGRTEALGARPCSGSNCDPQRLTQVGPDAQDQGSAEDSTTLPGQGSTSGSVEDPSGTAVETPDPAEPGLLPDLSPEGLPQDGGSREGGQDEDSSSGSESDAPGAPDDLSVPLPMLPPITLPPLLPGMPGIIIG